MNRRSNRVTTFRFPFDIDNRYFLALALVFFILSIRQVTDTICPRHSIPKVKARIEQDVHKKLSDFLKLADDSLLIHHAFSKSLSDSEFHVLNSRPYALYFYTGHRLIQWNTVSTKDPPDTFATDRPIPYQDSTGFYVLYQKNITSPDSKKSIVALFKVKNDFGVENEYFTKNFPVDDKENDFNIELSIQKQPTSWPLKIQDQVQFYMYKGADVLRVNDKNGWRFFLNVIPFILFGVSIHTYYKVKINKTNTQSIFTLLMLTILMVRTTTYLWGFPNDYHEFGLFSPEYFTFDAANRSLGDLFINMCLMFWALLFYLINVQGKVYDLRHNKYRYLIGVVIFLILLSGSLYLSELVYRLAIGSSINFDTTRFSELEYSSFIGILTFMAIFVNFVYLSIISRNYLSVCFSNKYVKYGLILAVFLFFYLVDFRLVYKECCIYTLICTAILFLMLDLNYLKTKFDFSSYKLLIWLIFISAVGSFFLTRLIAQKELLRMEKYASRLIVKQDSLIERKLSEKLALLETDSHFQTLADSLPADDKKLSYYVQTRFFSEADPEYRVRAGWNSFRNHDTSILSTLRDKSPKVKMVYQIEGDVYTLFPSMKTVHDDDRKFEIRIHANNLKPINEYADLLLPRQSPDLLKNELYSYACYINDRLVKRSGVYLFPFRLSDQLASDTSRKVIKRKANHAEVWMQNADTRTKVVIVKEDNDLFLFTTLFAYIFLIYFVTISLYILGNIVARSNLNYKRFINLMSINLRLRIHFSILLVELFSFIIIGYFTSYFLIEKVDSEMRATLSNFNYKIQDEFKQQEGWWTEVPSAGEVFKDSAQQSKQDKFREIADKFAINMNVYDVNKGKLLFSSMPGLFKKQVLSDYLEPAIFHAMNGGAFYKMIEEENVGFLNYLSSYFFIRNSEGEKIGIVQIPFFRSQTEFRTEATTIITTLINIYIFIFLISAIIAFFLTKSVTRPFTYIVKQFTKINLSKTNEPLKWFDSDEIGLLIKEYNRMLRKLENSTVLLAKNERELAWREMAKQVAHEIKNPLTPMKLSLQMLERAYKNNAPNLNEITIKMTKTLVEQIDNLSLIATNFSNFAKLPVSKNEIFPLNELLYSVTGMYHDDNNNEFLFMIPDYEITLYADKGQIMRVLTNIIQNALQSIPEDRKGNIALKVSKIKNHQIRISISDNGEGISDEKGKNLFQPYFTTKTSGTGLGLAMCKDIIEDSGGKITFESVVEKGTVFHIDLPVYQPE